MKQRVFSIVQGYEVTNNVEHIKNDPVFEYVLDGQLVSLPTLPRFGNRFDKHQIWNMCEGYVDRYVKNLVGRDELIIRYRRHRCSYSWASATLFLMGSTVRCIAYALLLLIKKKIDTNEEILTS